LEITVGESFRSVALLRKGVILAAGYVNKQAVLAQFNPATFTLDASFGKSGLFQYSYSFRPDINRIYVNPVDQRIYAAGFSTQGSAQNFLISRIIHPTTSTLEKDENTIALTAFPNPTSKSLTINYKLENAGDVSLDLYDLNGKLVSHLSNGFRMAASQTETFELSNLVTGTYICRLNTADGASNIKVNYIQ
jgi:hypothetical protein